MIIGPIGPKMELGRRLFFLYVYMRRVYTYVYVYVHAITMCERSAILEFRV